MQKYVFILLLSLLFVAGSLPAQEVILDNKTLLLKQNPAFKVYLQGDGRYLALDTYRFGFIKRHRFFVGDELTFKRLHQRKKFREQITAISDSSFTFSRFNPIINDLEHTEIKLSEVKKIKISRRIAWITDGAYALPIAGAMFILGDVLSMNNGVLDPGFDPKAALIGGGIASLGILCYQLSHPSYRLGKRHRLKVLRVR